MIEKLELTNDQIEALILYEGMVIGKIGSNKKEKYEAIGEKLKISPNTVKTWILRHYKKYMDYKEELEIKDSKRFNLEGLTGLEARYLKARLSGFGKEEAKEYAGYSENTKAADIEKQSKLKRTLEEIRDEFIEHEKYGVEVVVNNIDDVRVRANEYKVEKTQSTTFTTSDGKEVTTTIKNTNAFSAEIQASKAIASILGYDAKTSTVRQEKVGAKGRQRIKIEPRRK
ncbi:hypothetical protein [uncultured Cetobacterium sp.]|uniref:hypothetical protein n=1 Tax=uncultured Cetobacterium sp. TaxID=527638 RepID=UPI0026158DCA|nr:hypothetical protein [uncultured Cetobacterium sp.]